MSTSVIDEQLMHVHFANIIADGQKNKQRFFRITQQAQIATQS